MRAVTAIALFAVATQAAALPAGAESSLERRAIPIGSDPEHPGAGGIDIDPTAGGTSDPPAADPPAADPPKVDPPKVDPPKVDPPKVDPPKVDPPKVDPSKNEGEKHEGEKHEGEKHEGEKHEGDKHETETYEPDYPSNGGYKNPNSYEPECAYSKPGYSIDKDDYSGEYGSKEYPYDNKYPKAGDYGQRDNYGDDYAPSGYKKPSGGYEVSYPSHGEKVECGKKHTFKWHAPEGKKYKIELVYGKGKDDCHTYQTIADDCDNNGSYDWDVPKNLPPTGGKYGYGVRFTCKDTGKVFYSPQFHFENPDFYNHYKHPACPTEKPAPIEYPVYHAPVQTETPVAETPCPTPAVETPAAETPCPTPEAPAVVPVTNATEPVAPVYTGAASGLKASFSFVAGLAVLVAFIL